MAFTFKYACFVSYCHGQADLVAGFLEQFKSALRNELELLLDEDIYIDEERLRPGYAYNEALAQAICQSVCMIVVYSPRYERHEYCLREFEAMAKLEAERRALLGGDATTCGFIIPVILRGADSLPPRMRQHIHYADFSRFTLATPEIARNPDYVGEIQKIARVIFDQYNAFHGVPAPTPNRCLQFRLPEPGEVAPWRPTFVNR